MYLVHYCDYHQQIQIEGHPSLCAQDINLQNENKPWLLT